MIFISFFSAYRKICYNIYGRRYSMILVDKEIKQLVKEGMLIVEHYQEDHLNSISYDLTLQEVIGHEAEDDIVLEPNHFLIGKTLEKIKIPNQLLGRIEEKNSLLRLGLVISGPCYQPGHVTYGYLRIYNASNHPIKLKKGIRIAQIVFEQLSSIPDCTYANQKNASFQNEMKYREYGAYQNLFQKLQD